MGIIRAITQAIGGGLADQWLEVYEADDMGDNTVFTSGVLIRKGQNRKGTPDTVSNGSIIHVYDNQFMMLVDGGKIDPDDKTPLAIKNTGAEIISYGAPVLPGAMFLISYYNGNVPILGLPGCVMYAKRTIFDLVLPRIMADDEVTAEELAALGEGGLCLNCDHCIYPNCGFGKGW